jgi:predicted XRE-type DNA-binding protein
LKKTPEFEISSGNVFADLGLPHPEELQAKSDLMFEISRTIEERGLTQAEAAEILGIDQPKVSSLVRGRVTGFSMERLYRYLNALGKDVEIVIHSASGRKRAQPGVRVVRSGRGRKATQRVAVRKRGSVAAKKGRAKR